MSGFSSRWDEMRKCVMAISGSVTFAGLMFVVGILQGSGTAGMQRFLVRADSCQFSEIQKLEFVRERMSHYKY